jgi:hypothetical protein
LFRGQRSALGHRRQFGPHNVGIDGSLADPSAKATIAAGDDVVAADEVSRSGRCAINSGGERVVQRLDMEPRLLAEFRDRQVSILDVPTDRQVGAVDLQGDPGCRNRLVFTAHRLRDREQVRFLARVVVVAEEQRYDARRGGAEESAGGVNPGEGRFQVIDVGKWRGRVADRDRACAGGRSSSASRRLPLSRAARNSSREATATSPLFTVAGGSRHRGIPSLPMM